MIARHDLPRLALSIRQPWAWAICYGGKDLENRSWGGPYNANNRGFRGSIAIHASSGMTRHEYLYARDFMARRGVCCPLPADLVRGAIIGTATVVDWITKSHSPWFMGPGALRLEGVEPLDVPIPCSGALGFFEWKEGGSFAVPAKWMLPREERSLPPKTEERQGNLL